MSVLRALSDWTQGKKASGHFVVRRHHEFSCGLPGWAIMRRVFNFIERNRVAGIDDVAEEMKDVCNESGGDFVDLMGRGAQA
jgi:hypothetical protein